jgi:hypothetical protein
VQVAGVMYVYFNGNGATTSYSAVRLMSDGSAASSGLTTGEAGIQVLGADYSSATANTFGNQELYIPNYAGSTVKQTSNFGVAETNATSLGSAYAFGAVASLFNSTAAITSVTIIPVTGNWVSGSSFYLYGISKN